jgi:hypothetical protein
MARDMKSWCSNRSFPASIVVLLLPLCGATQDVFEGEWMLEIRPTGAPIIGLLQIEKTANDWSAFVEGGPAPVRIDKDNIELLIDTRDLSGFPFNWKLVGTFADGELSGTFSKEGATEFSATGGTWTAVPYVPRPPPSPAKPVDMSGTWTAAPGVDFRKYSMDLTPAAQEWFDGYLMHYDQPNVRCVSPGIVAMVAWGAYPFEILQSADRLTFIYEFESEVRRIYLDGRNEPEYYPHSPMGFSTATWDGSDLVVETHLLSQNIRDFRGEPLSENATMQEIYSLSEDGNTLSAVITLTDTENYKRSPIRRRKWTRNPETEIFPYECDPDSFYRQMYNEGLLEMYFERSKRRF